MCANNWSTSNAMTVNCTFDIFPFHIIGVVYRCAGEVSFDGETDDKITAVYGTHLDENQNADVQGLIISSQNMEFFPVNIHEFFPDIKVLNFPLNAIRSVTENHLIPFPNLEFLALYGNRITTLESGLFKRLKSLKFVNLGRNRIAHVGHDFVLPATAEIYLYSNVCIDRDAVTELEITHLRFSLMMNCPPETLPTDTNIGNTSNTTPNAVRILKEKYLQLEMRVSFVEAIIDSARCLKIEDPKLAVMTNKK